MPRKRNGQGPGRGWRAGSKIPRVEGNQEADSPKRKGSRRRGERREEDEVIDRRIDKILDAPDLFDEDGVWETNNEDDADADDVSPFQGELSLSELVALRPYKMEELGGGVIQFRVSDRVARAAQRVKERSRGVYDIMSDLHRDIYMLGLLIMSERHADSFSVEMIIESLKAITNLKKDTKTAVEKLAAALEGVDERDRRVKFLAFIRSIRTRSSRVQEYYLEAVMETPMLREMYERLGRRIEED